jgi:hypothetical protein
MVYGRQQTRKFISTGRNLTARRHKPLYYVFSSPCKLSCSPAVLSSSSRRDCCWNRLYLQTEKRPVRQENQGRVCVVTFGKNERHNVSRMITFSVDKIDHDVIVLVVDFIYENSRRVVVIVDEIHDCTLAT